MEGEYGRQAEQHLKDRNIFLSSSIFYSLLAYAQKEENSLSRTEIYTVPIIRVRTTERE